MAQLVLIKSTHLQDDRQPGDIVDIFSDDRKFSPEQHEKWDIVKVRESVEELAAQLPKLYQKLFWEPVPGELREVVNPPRFEARWDGEKVVENFSRHEENSEKTITEVSMTKEG